jgi:protein-L-isoaspartate O-methyltransferase
MRRRPFLLPLIGALALGGVLVSGCLQQPDADSSASDAKPLDSLEVVKEAPYITTPQWVVERMLKMADVDEDDVVYDLGSGDGRFVITAARQFGARGVGIEINPRLLRQARTNARLAGVEDRVTFRQGDLYKADLREATVVTVYLDTKLNVRLRPRLLRQLDPGDRVVSHNYGMGAWTPDRVEQIGDRTIYLWTLPAQPPDSLLQR